MGAKVVGLSNGIPTKPSNYEASNINSFVEEFNVDVRDANAVQSVVKKSNPDFVFHLAAQSLVRPSYKSPLETFMVNAIGTANLLNALTFIDKPVVAIMITSDKAYDNVECKWGYRETDRLGGKDPYSASKGMAELAIYSYTNSFFKKDDSNIRIGITRAGNVIGGGDWAEDRIGPDCVKSWKNNETINIRSPLSTRPWQHVLEPLSGYLSLGASLNNSSKLHGEAYNFGPNSSQNYSVSDLINEMIFYWSGAKWNDISGNDDDLHEAGLLKLNCDKALHDLNWMPTLNFSETVKKTVEWYQYFYENPKESMIKITSNQIMEYSQLANKRGLFWALND
jgi:CDP-glucose 4,6-dehydratase